MYNFPIQDSEKMKVKFTDDPCWYNNCPDLICHYTSYNGLFGILDKLKLRVSSFLTLNDANEINLMNYYCNDSVKRVFTIDFIKKHCGILSFTKQFSYHNRSYCCASKPSMWAYYGENMKGACIVIDKVRFEAYIEEYLKGHFYKFDDVKYDVINARGMIHIEERDEDTVKNNCHKLFFIKHFDWQQENEKRLFLIDDFTKEFSLDISKCLSFIVLGWQFIENEESREKLKALLSDKTVACHSIIDTNSFAFITPSECGYSLYPANNRLNKSLCKC